MNSEELWLEVLNTLKKAESKDDFLQVGINIIMSYMDSEDAEELILGLEERKLHIYIEEPENTITTTKH